MKGWQKTKRFFGYIGRLIVYVFSFTIGAPIQRLLVGKWPDTESK